MSLMLFLLGVVVLVIGSVMFQLLPNSWQLSLKKARGQLRTIYPIKVNGKQILFLQEDHRFLTGGKSKTAATWRIESIVDLDSFSLSKRYIAHYQNDIRGIIGNRIWCYNYEDGIYAINAETGEVEANLKSILKANPNIKENSMDYHGRSNWNKWKGEYEFDANTRKVWIPTKDGRYYSLDSNLKFELVEIPPEVKNEPYTENKNNDERFQIDPNNILEIKKEGRQKLKGLSVTSDTIYLDARFFHLENLDDSRTPKPILLLHEKLRDSKESCILTSLHPDGTSIWNIQFKNIFADNKEYGCAVKGYIFKNEYIILLSTNLGLSLISINPETGKLDKSLILK